jgi:uncharacterized membrane protein
MMAYAMPYLAFLVTLGVLDALWLGWLAKPLYQADMGPLMRDQVRWQAALLFYLLYPMGVMALAWVPGDLARSVGKAALVGALVYGVYDLTNLAVLKHWTVRLAVLDAVWGTLVAALSMAAAVWVAKRSG